MRDKFLADLLMLLLARANSLCGMVVVVGGILILAESPLPGQRRAGSLALRGLSSWIYETIISSKQKLSNRNRVRMELQFLLYRVGSLTEIMISILKQIDRSI